MIPRIRCYIGLHSSAFTPEEMSKRLGLEPTGKWYQGEITKYSRAKPQEEHYWELSTPYEESWDVNEQMAKVIDQIDKEKLKALMSTQQVSGVIESVIKFEDSAPAVYLEKEIIKLAAETGLTFDFDIYNVKEEEK
jgi:hypothetical protein